jgi:hypothetical protein
VANTLNTLRNGAVGFIDLPAPAAPTSFFDCAADLAQVLAKSVIRIRTAFLEIVGKSQLLAQSSACFDLISLFSLCGRDVASAL